MEHRWLSQATELLREWHLHQGVIHEPYGLESIHRLHHQLLLRDTADWRAKLLQQRQRKLAGQCQPRQQGSHAAADNGCRRQPVLSAMYGLRHKRIV